MNMAETLSKIGEDLRNKECPELFCNILQIQDTLDVLSGKCKNPILFAVLEGYGKFTDSFDFFLGLTDKVLNNRLKDLIGNKITDKYGGQ